MGACCCRIPSIADNPAHQASTPMSSAALSPPERAVLGTLMRVAPNYTSSHPFIAQATDLNAFIAALVRFEEGRQKAIETRNRLLEAELANGPPSAETLAAIASAEDDEGLEFCLAASFDPRFIADLMYHGFITMAGSARGLEFLTPKLHTQRCMVDFARVTRPQKSSVKRATKRKHTITVSKVFEGVCSEIVTWHGEAWLYRRLRETLGDMSRRRDLRNGKIRIVSFEIWAPQGNGADGGDSDGDEMVDAGERDRILVAGEIGVCVGSIYVSYSGFCSEDGAGTVQMYSMAALLVRCGFKLWDLGMGLQYKYATYGAGDVPRTQFLARLEALRDDEAPLLALDRLIDAGEMHPCAELLKKARADGWVPDRDAAMT
ncbi:hypothetical protein DFJ74DRAFT_753924 [Hyaloraphidium curvatum]|nr:hypothetical protein DFJ74DRAFT_753924 [Hyaloraphidium curvatum]